MVNELRYVPYPLFTSDLAPLDFHQFPKLKTVLGGLKFVIYGCHVMAAVEDFVGLFLRNIIL